MWTSIQKPGSKGRHRDTEGAGPSPWQVSSPRSQGQGFRDSPGCDDEVLSCVTPTPASASARDEAVDILVQEPCLLSLLWGRFPGVEALSQSFNSFTVIDVVTSLALMPGTSRGSSNHARKLPSLGHTANTHTPAARRPPHPRPRNPFIHILLSALSFRWLPTVTQPLKADGSSWDRRSGQQWPKATSPRPCNSGHFLSRRHFVVSHHPKKGEYRRMRETTFTELLLQYIVTVVLVCGR